MTDNIPLQKVSDRRTKAKSERPQTNDAPVDGLKGKTIAEDQRARGVLTPDLLEM